MSPDKEKPTFDELFEALRLLRAKLGELGVAGVNPIGGHVLTARVLDGPTRATAWTDGDEDPESVASWLFAEARSAYLETRP